SAKAKRAAKEQVTLEFPDNKLLADLAGAHQKNFVRLEQKLGLRIDMRGNLVAIEGTAEQRERGASILRALYARLEAGDSGGSGGAGAETAFAGEKSAGAVASPSGPPAIKPAPSKATRARPPAQAAYLALMRPHPLVFGIGPAGTGKTYLAAAFGAHLLH